MNCITPKSEVSNLHSIHLWIMVATLSRSAVSSHAALLTPSHSALRASSVPWLSRCTSFFHLRGTQFSRSWYLARLHTDWIELRRIRWQELRDDGRSVPHEEALHVLAFVHARVVPHNQKFLPVHFFQESPQEYDRITTLSVVTVDAEEYLIIHLHSDIIR